jgi:fatty-acid peroxygenase
MPSNQGIPREKGIDHTLDLLIEGYPFIQNRIKKYQSPIVISRVLGKKAIFLSGVEEAKVFYSDKYFKRHGVAPMHVQKTLFGKKAIQGLDGAEHQKRKQLFMSLLSPEYEKRLLDLCAKNLERRSKEWENKSSIKLFDESKKVLFLSVCEWAAVPYPKKREKEFLEDFGYMIYSFGRVGSYYRKGKRSRKCVEQWIEQLIEEVRLGIFVVDKSTPLYLMSMCKDVNGELVDIKIAARELINLLRPIIAIATYITFIGLALYENPECKEKLKGRDPLYLEMFCQEVRRYYPFSPFVGAKVKKSFRWKNCIFKKNTLVFLDLYGMMHDEKIWDQPYAFIPERFESRKKCLYDLMPQGGGKIMTGHRCAGDIVTLKLMMVFTDFLVNKMEYTVPKQDLYIPLNQIPTLPRSGFVIKDVKTIR